VTAILGYVRSLTSSKSCPTEIFGGKQRLWQFVVSVVCGAGSRYEFFGVLSGFS
jgi:ADP-glucose pyrophosphorylase